MTSSTTCPLSEVERILLLALVPDKSFIIMTTSTLRSSRASTKSVSDQFSSESFVTQTMSPVIYFLNGPFSASIFIDALYSSLVGHDFHCVWGVAFVANFFTEFSLASFFISLSSSLFSISVSSSSDSGLSDSEVASSSVFSESSFSSSDDSSVSNVDSSSIDSAFSVSKEGSSSVFSSGTLFNSSCSFSTSVASDSNVSSSTG